jgi:hypothetical protein
MIKLGPDRYVTRHGRIVDAFYPVFPPDRNAAGVVVWPKANPRKASEPEPFGIHLTFSPDFSGLTPKYYIS